MKISENLYRFKIVTVCIALVGVFTPFGSAAVLISDDFSTSNMATNSRIRTNQTNGNWYTSTNVTSEWTTTAGVMSSSGVAGGADTEGALSQVIATDSLSNTLTHLTLSFNYTVGATSTLKFALIGYTLNVQDGQSSTNTLLMNNGTSNGSLQNNTQAELRYGDINLFTGADMTQSITNDLTFTAGTTGSHMSTIDLTSYSWHADEAASNVPANTPGLSGSITSVSDFDYIAFVVVNDQSTAVGATATSIDNVSLEAIAIPEPSTVVLLALGLTGLGVRRRKR